MRGLCAGCGRNHYVGTDGLIGPHTAKGLTGYSLGYTCKGVGKAPGATDNPNLVGYGVPHSDNVAEVDDLTAIEYALLPEGDDHG